MSVEKASFAALCRGCRAILGWSQSELAEKTQMAVTSIARIEQGAINPRHDTVMSLFRVFQEAGITVSQDNYRGGFSITVDARLFEKQ